jgi:hypothetical protein
MEHLRGGDIQVQQPRQGQIDLLDLRQRDLVVQSAEGEQFRLGQRQRRVIAQS